MFSLDGSFVSTLTTEVHRKRRELPAVNSVIKSEDHDESWLATV